MWYGDWWHFFGVGQGYLVLASVGGQLCVGVFEADCCQLVLVRWLCRLFSCGDAGFGGGGILVL